MGLYDGKTGFAAVAPPCGRHPYIRKTKYAEKPQSKLRNRTEHWQRLRQKNMVFEFSTWNVRTLYKTGDLLSVISQIGKYKLPVVAVQETRRHGNGINDVKGHSVLYSGKKKGTHESGVAFIANQTFKNNIIDQAINDRICTMQIRMKFYNITMINIYAPTEDKKPNIKDEFYNKLETMLDDVPSNDVKIVLGDYNAQIGKEKEFRKIVRRNSLHDVSNDNGKRMIDFAESGNLIVSSTQFARKDIHKQTWRSPDGKTTIQIDHILIDKRRAS
ncbi:PREDICTED: craniofacial development protein 2-like [Dinoponera quadriceps]|uniref:Craniofacial development protein 2-like n=1 Tax=Dinoponera quadriceps TaxID=609295 RepID=A0A6P3X658_DINQU|nr:PREDICTED: craniofacial development protein 2-like [Dinoponera quadriceps]